MCGDEMRKTQKQLVKDAAAAHSDLNIFAAIVEMLEGGTVSSDAEPYDAKVISLCQRAQQQCLRRYDRAMNALGMPYGRHPTEPLAAEPTKRES